MKCKICNKDFNVSCGLSIHLSSFHNIDIISYYVSYEGFEIPKCKICELKAKHKKALKFYKTCGDKSCVSKLREQSRHTEKTKEIMRQKRLNYMKNNPESTAWRLGNKPSYIEQVFIDALQNNGLFDKFEIIREKCFYPYYADFAFENVKVVVEIDGSQHKREDYKERDIKKEKLIISNGWRVFRATGEQVYGNVNDVIEELLIFIGDINYISKTSSIITGKQKREIEAQHKKANQTKTKLQIKKELEISNKIDLLLKSGIDFNKFGWVNKASKILNITPQNVNRWMKRNMLEFYENDCFRRPSDQKFEKL